MIALWPIIQLLFSGIGKFVSAAFTFLTTKPGVYILIAGLFAGAYWYSGHEGYKRAVADDKAAYALAQAKAETAAADKARKDQIALDKGMADAAFAAGEKKGKSEAKTIILTKEIPTYVTVETDRAFPVACGLYRVLYAAADASDPSTVSLPPGLVDGSACPIAASDLAALGVTWAGIDHGKDAQIEGLQALARTLAAAVSQ